MLEIFRKSYWTTKMSQELKDFVKFFKTKTKNQGFGDLCDYVIVFLNWIGNRIISL